MAVEDEEAGLLVRVLLKAAVVLSASRIEGLSVFRFDCSGLRIRMRGG